MRTYHVFVNLTLSVDPRTVARARKAAQAQGKSLNQVLREYLEQLAGQRDPAELVEELRRLRLDYPGDSSGWRFQREELYDRT